MILYKILKNLYYYFTSPFRWLPTYPDKMKTLRAINPTLNNAVKAQSDELIDIIEGDINRSYEDASKHYEDIEKKSNIILYGYIGLHSIIIAHVFSTIGPKKTFAKIDNLTEPFFSNEGLWFLVILLIFEGIGWLSLFKSLKVSTYFSSSQGAIFPNLKHPLVHRGYILQHRWYGIKCMREVDNFKAISLLYAQVSLIFILMVLVTGILKWRIL